MKLNEQRIQLGPGQKLLFDALPIRLSLTEDAQGSRLLVRGEFARAGLATENKRVYPLKLWEREIKKLTPKMVERKLYGELDHPQDGTSSLARASHIITSMDISQDGKVVGEAEVLDTAKGRDLRALLDAGCKVGISSRGYGSTRTNEAGEEVVQEDYNLVTFDFVADPADSTAYPDVVSESAVRSEEKQVMTGTDSDALEKKFEAEILSRLGELSASARTQLREELLKDPNVAGAQTALEQIKSILSPFLLAEDTDASKQLSALQLKVQEQELRIAELEASEKQLESIAREAANKFYVERALAGRQDRSLVLKLLGDMKQYESADSLKSKLEGILGELKAAQEAEKARAAAEAARMEQLRREARRELEAIQAENAELKATTAQLSEALEKTLEANQEIGLQAYAMARLARHPDGQHILQALESKGFSSKEDIDALIEEHRIPEAAPEDMEVLRARVRKLTQGGRGRTPVEEERPRKARKPLRESNFNGTGVDVNTMLALSGIGPKAR